MDAPKVAIILVKYNQPALEAATIRHVLDTVDYPNWTLVAHQNERGVGLARCWNRLIAAQDAEYIVLLNTDTVPTSDWFARLVAALREGAPAAVPSSNRVHLSQIDTSSWWAEEPGPETIQKFAAALRAREGAQVSLMESASAMCAAFPRAVWEAVGGFDEDFLFYGEDTDFFYRVAQQFGPVVWVRGAYVHHYGQQSMAKAVADGEIDYPKLRAEAQQMYEAKRRKEAENVSSQDNG